MSKEVTGQRIVHEPAHPIFCKRCRYMYTIVTHCGGNSYHSTDIYEQCGEWSEKRYVLNFSGTPGDYHSAVTLDDLLMKHVIVKVVGDLTTSEAAEASGLEQF